MRKFCCLLILCFVFPIYGQAQIKFIENKGQWEQPVHYKADVAGGSLFITQNELRYHFREIEGAHHHTKEKETSTRIRGHAMFIEWVGASANAQYTSDSAFSEYYNYFLGNDQSRWKSGIKAYGKVRADNLYDGIDMLMESKGDYLKVTYFADAGAATEKVKLKVTGAEDIFLQDGNLHIRTSLNEIIENAPVAFQTIDGIQREVDCRFSLQGDVVSFEFPNGYRKDLPLIIDPTLIFATYSGSKADNFGFTATYDFAGHAYTGGTVYSTGFPVVAGAYDTTWNGGATDTLTISDIPRDAGILKFSDDGTKLLWASYLGGSSNEQPHSMVVDSSNNLVILGTTHSKNFPVTSSAFDTSHNGQSDIFVSKLSADGKSLLASTFIGGSGVDGYNGILTPNSNPQTITGGLYFNYGDQFRGEVVSDNNNNVYVASCSYSTNFPVSTGAFQTQNKGKQDAVIFKLNSSFQNLVWSTYAGGKEYDAVYGLQIDNNYNVFTAGGSNSPDSFFTDNNAYQTGHNNHVDGFILHIKNDGKSIINGTYLGTNVYDQIYFIQLDADEDVYVYGQTKSGSFPVKNVGFSNSKGKQFVSKFSKDLSTLTYSTVFGSGGNDPDISPTAFLIDTCEKVYVSGWGADFSPLAGMPLTPDAIQDSSQSSDFYLAVFAKDVDEILYGSYIGGTTSDDHVDGGTSRFDKRGVIYQAVCAGCGGYSDFPVTTNAWSTTNKGIRPNSTFGGCNNLVFKMALDVPDLKAEFKSTLHSCISDTLEFLNTSLRAKSYIWDFGDGNFSNAESPKHKYFNPGVYVVKLIGINPLSCTVYDTVYHTVTIYDKADASFSSNKPFCSQTVEFFRTGTANTYHWDFGDSTAQDTGTHIQHTYQKPGKYLITMVADSGKICADTLQDSVEIIFPYADFDYDIDTCTGLITFNNLSLYSDSYIWEIDTIVTQVKDPTFIYEKNDSIDVTLTSIDTNGCSQTIIRKLYLPDALVADFDIKPDSCTGIYTFTNKSTGADSFVWSFGDGTVVMDTVKGPITKQYTTNDTFTVRLIAVGSSGCTDTFAVEVNYKVAPKAGFSFIFDQCTKTAHFSDSSVNADVVLWMFGDGVTGFERNPSHKYQSGTYTITQVISTSANCLDTFTRDLIVADSQEAHFTYYQDSCTLEIYFVDKSTDADSMVWDFGGTYSNERNPVYQFSQPGTYQVSQIINPGPCADTATESIIVEPLPDADFIPHQDSCSFTIAFENTSIRGYNSLWDFGDGTSSTENNPSHTYDDTGLYEVRLVVNSSLACPDTLSKFIKVDVIPEASFSYVIDTCNYKVSFTDSSIKGSSYLWFFGDGETDTNKNISHQYISPGKYTVSLIINRESACRDTIIQTIDVPSRPQAFFNYIVDSCSMHVRFFDSSSKAQSYQWDFGDGSKPATDKNPQHQYEDGGLYTVKVVINQGTACADSFERFIYVSPKPKADFEMYVDTCTGLIVVNNKSAGANTYLWELNDGRTSTERNPTFSVENRERYIVKLTINPKTGCSASVEKKIEPEIRAAGFNFYIDSCSGKVIIQNLSEFASSYYWEFGNGKSSDKENPSITYTQAGDYQLMLIINPGTICADTSYTQVNIAKPGIQEIVIPNVFTPNNDGYNDYFEIDAPIGCDEYQIEIFNRWGQLVHQDKAGQIKWDGNYDKNLEPLPDGTYYFIFYSAKYGEIKGTVTILR